MGAVVAIDSLLDQRRLWKGQQRHVLPRQSAAERPRHARCSAALGRLARQRADRTADAGRWRRRAAPAVADAGAAVAAGWNDRRGRTAVRAVRTGVAARPACACRSCRSSTRRHAMRCGRPSNACVRARARRCCAGRCTPTIVRCGGCRWRPRPGVASASRSAERKAARNPSPAALRIAIETDPQQLRVLKCRGGLAPTRPVRLRHGSEAGPSCAGSACCCRNWRWTVSCAGSPMPEQAAGPDRLARCSGACCIRSIRPRVRSACGRGNRWRRRRRSCRLHQRRLRREGRSALASTSSQPGPTVSARRSARSSPHAIVLEIGRSLKLFGPWPRLGSAAARGTARAGLPPSPGRRAEPACGARAGQCPRRHRR